MATTFPNPSPLWRPEQEHDACGVGFIAHLRGERSHALVERALEGLRNLAHRGAIDADSVTGDGAGLLTQIPHELIRRHLTAKGRPIPRDEDIALAMIFLPREDYQRSHGKKILEEAVRAEGLSLVAWRQVPVDPACLGKKAELTRPDIWQAVVARKTDVESAISDDEFERRCFLATKVAERRAAEARVEGFYICSFSSRTVTYKGLFNAPQVRKFYTDLKDPSFTTAYVLFHQRFATNTLPDWSKAHPFRCIAHNGEINTIRGNRNMMRAREFSDISGKWGERYADLRPIIQPDMSDSASFDNAFQLLVADLPPAKRCGIVAASMMMPVAWEKDPHLPERVRNFYHYQSLVMEPWDGPAAVVFTDGRLVGASLDRNGLRPLRYKQYADGTVVAASEAGLIASWGSPVVRAGRLGPGRMFALDLAAGRFLDDDDCKQILADRRDYGAFLRESVLDLHRLAQGKPSPSADGETLPHQLAFGSDLEERDLILAPMANTAQEAVGSMGDDTPLAALSRRPRLLPTYFKQLFAQVTNPPIDPIRESLVMSLTNYLGGQIGIYEPLEERRTFLQIDTPFLLPAEHAEIPAHFDGKLLDLDATFAAASGPGALEPALRRLGEAAVEAVRDGGVRLVRLSDRATSAERAPIPALLAVGFVHQTLVRAGLRLRCGIVVETGEARDVHQLACLIGYGATAVFPWLAYEVVRDLHAGGKLDPKVGLDQAFENYRKAAGKGLLKIMSKMGISTLLSYQGAQVFEALGIGDKVVADCFEGTPSPIGGVGYEEIAGETLRRHTRAFAAAPAELPNEGWYLVNKKGDGEAHGWSPKVVAGMGKFLKSGADAAGWSEWRTAADEHAPLTLKDLLALNFAAKPLDLAEVEPAAAIRRRFTTAGMSLGALSPEAHECLAIAMNRIGGKSNSGEGGEDPRRFRPLENGDNANSAIKQVASGRFGVTAEYLASAKEIEIKIAQGAKPGEGGQLPGHKVSPLIATLRYSVPGVTLISPPPHHDIYSIEDLAQLIYDLKCVNPRAKVCVKLVSCSGVGTVAAGVAKAYADVILVSGHEGGTAASPLSSVKSAGSAWEIGIAEAHQVLMMNDLRGHVTLRTDGGMKTGRDIVIAAILGAEEFNFGTAALIAAGCAMFRVCHLNTCPVGVATQREDLRAKFRGKPENVIHFFNAVAEDVRAILAKLGKRSLDEVVGRTELLRFVPDADNPKTARLRLDGLLFNPDPSGDTARRHARERNNPPDHDLVVDDIVLQDARHVLVHKGPGYAATHRVRNIHRNIGTRLAGEIAYLHGNKGLPEGLIDLTFEGSSGQSFGTFCVQGMRLRLVGEANDYVGKGMNGGEIIVRPSPDVAFPWHENIIMGNTCLYGATGGTLLAAGRAGERFGVRNSGASAVIEGVGDHGCEYMTGGTVVVLGPVGRNFAAGMSGGLAFVWDPDRRLETLFNPEMVELKPVPESESDALRALVARHADATSSPHAKALLADWTKAVAAFRRVTPHGSALTLGAPVGATA
jgi:glutamate synthase (NADPH/NADH) large chain/glutamate synthase (ferredoxin)